MRDAELQTFLDRTETSILRRSESCPGAGPAAGRIFSALRNQAAPPGSSPACSVPGLGRLDAALTLARRGPPEIAGLADALSAIAPRLHWTRRKGAEMLSQSFFEGHANAMVIGPGGLEERDDVEIGISLMAPGLRYPDHDHPPEEVYVSLAGGSWWKAGADWREPGQGGLVYNQPGVMHAMATADEPLLAVWCLWMARPALS